MKTLIRDISIVNEGKVFIGSVVIEDHLIRKVTTDPVSGKFGTIIEGKGLYLFPGAIDDQVHFREPGLVHKAEIYTESRAAVAGGVTSFMEMPNTVPNTLTQELLEEKYARAFQTSLANYSFFMGASNDNLGEVLKTDPASVCGVKIFMGSSTGNMLVDNKKALNALFSECRMLIATHCEDEGTVKSNLEAYRKKYGENIPVEAHPLIRSAEACYKSSSLAVELAHKYNTRLHILHISTAKEIGLFRNDIPVRNKMITAEACIHHLWFCDKDYKKKGNFIKWNPAVKTELDREGVWKGVLEGNIDVICTDHAPHTREEKEQKYINAPSGGPLIQHSLVAMLECYHKGRISLQKIAEKMSHNVADCFRIHKRGYIREDYFADLVVVDLEKPWQVTAETNFYKCGWSPFDGDTFSSRVIYTLVNGNVVYDNSKGNVTGIFDERAKGQRLIFDRQ